MSIKDGLLVSLFGISVVFFVLIALSFLVRLQSFVFGRIAEKQKPAAAEDGNGQSAGTGITGPELSSGELKLIGVDEKTAAIIMAIVSDESRIPLSELRFKSIKLLDQ